MEIERRFFTREIRMETDEETGQRKLIGYAAVFEQLSEDLGGFREIIRPGAFTRSIKEDDVRSLFNHDYNLVLGRNRAKTLRLTEDDIGLRYEIDLPDTSYAHDLIISMDRGDVDQSSFGFRAREDSWREPTEEQPLPVRALHDVELYDAGPVTIPAYPQTSAQVRSYIKENFTASGGASGGGSPTGHVGRLARLRRQLELAERM